MTRKLLEQVSNDVIRKVFETENKNIDDLIEAEFERRFSSYPKFEKLRKSEMLRETKEFMRMIVGI